MRKRIQNIKFLLNKIKQPQSSENIAQYDAKQASTLTQELILVNSEDKILGKISKEEAHQLSYINSANSHPHRAFSIFLFNSNNELLVHQRSATKITFPLQWTNSCCSHPLYCYDQINDIKISVDLRLQFELGIKLSNHQINDMVLVDKILYKAEYDQVWGEYELDYVFFLKGQFNLDNFRFNNDEIQNAVFISKNQLRSFLSSKKTTPWFQLIVDQHLDQWWDQYIFQKNI